MFESRPPRSPGVPVGYAITIALLLLSAVAIYFLFNRPITLLSFFLGFLLFLSAPTITLLLYWTMALGRARYRVTADSLQIAWGPVQHELPLSDVQLVEEPPAEAAQLQSFRGLRWPGYLLGRGQLDDDQRLPVTFFATQPPPGALLVTSSGERYGLSPQEPGAFREALTAALSQLPHDAARSPVKRSGWLDWPIWRDRIARGLLVAAPLLNALHFAVLAGIFPTLPGEVPLHMDGAGLILLSGPPSRLFLPPIFGLLSWMINALLGWFFYQRRDEQAIAYLLWSAGVILQILALTSLPVLLP